MPYTRTGIPLRAIPTDDGFYSTYGKHQRIDNLENKRKVLNSMCSYQRSNAEKMGEFYSQNGVASIRVYYYMAHDVTIIEVDTGDFSSVDYKCFAY
jgi:hypothetical protein